MMKFKIIAAAPDDGWGFVSEEEKIFLLCPPYTSSDKIEVSMKVVENAIHIRGFEECDITLDNPNEVVRSLKEMYIESKRKRDIDPPSSEKLKEFLKYATDDVLQGYLNRAYNELIPEGKLDAAEAIALDLLDLENVQHNTKMLSIATDILKKCRQEREGLKKLVFDASTSSQETWVDRFSNAVDRYSLTPMIERQKQTSSSGQMMPMCAGC
jgi:hypothetical protein